MPASVERLSAWHFSPGALHRLIPPWVSASVESPAGIAEGSRAFITMRLGPWRSRWTAVHREVLPGERFTDELERGPFRRWRHTHRFLPDGARRSRLEDHIEYELPGGRFGAALGGRWVRSEMRRAFEFRHRRTAHDLARHAESLTVDPLRIAVSGASGLVGSALVPFLSGGGHQVRRLVRPESSEAAAGAGRPQASADHAAARRHRLDVAWDPRRGAIDAAGLEGLDAVVHLAGAGIADKRWSPERRREIRESRVASTRLLARTLASLTAPPRVLISASAIGWYGDRGEREVDERAERGSGFLAEVCDEWEQATQEAEQAGIRVVHLRIGLVLSARGGVLGRLATIFRWGGGGPVGSGRQGMSWIALDDLLGAILFSIVTPSVHGVVNAVGPSPCSNRDFGRALAHVLRRPFLFPAPAFAVRALLGEMGDQLLLRGAFVQPSRLLEHRFRFDFPSLESALRFELGRSID